MKKLTTFSTLFVLGSLLGCGGGGSKPAPAPPQATSLAYTNPTSGSYQLLKNTALSSGTKLVFDLMGPSTGTGSGVSITLTAGAQVSWVNVNAEDSAGTYLGNGTAFVLGDSPQILKAQVTGNTLVATLAEKGHGAPKALNVPLLRVAVNLKPGVGTAPGAAVTLTPGDCKLLDSAGTLQPITLTAGTLLAQ